MIEAHGLKKSFGKVQALKDVSFVAPDGKVTGLLGPNGAGKSTTLRILYTVLNPDAGTAVIDGADIRSDSMGVRRKIGVLPHSAGLYPNLSARENIAYYGRILGMQDDALQQRIDELAGLLELEDVIDRRAKGFSQGQRTKVALARALVHKPRNLLLDEPTNGLDVMATRALRELILKLKDEGICILFSSHIMQEVAALCDEIVIIGSGRVVAAGTPEALRQSTGEQELEEAFVKVIGSAEGLQ
ncbi:MAG: ATP-binding cassette domain-containing protein [Gammaproteobacteria bacterium]|jgi:sodium transport system ATP-binding protein|nr:ATP-binding cassette domain-containing protein [Gammaproteobacteria bacterium]